MGRVQLALNVEDLDDAVAFYSKLFDTPPAKIRPGYANFAIADPPLKLVLFEAPGRGGTLNHLGVELAEPAEVAAASARLTDRGLTPSSEDEVACCYALQDKIWVDDPSGAPWELYAVLADADTLGAEEPGAPCVCRGDGDVCCS
jgi:hypothetical protein